MLMPEQDLEKTTGPSSLLCGPRYGNSGMPSSTVGKGLSSKMVSGLEEQNPSHSQKETFSVRTEETCRNESQ